MFRPSFRASVVCSGRVRARCQRPIKTDASGGFEQLLMASVGSISGIFLPALQCRSTVGGKMLNIKFCSNYTTEKLGSLRRRWRCFGALRLRVRNGQIHRTPQLRCVGFIGIGGVGAERGDLKLPICKTPGPKLRIAHRVCPADGAPELPLGRAQKFLQRLRQIVTLQLPPQPRRQHRLLPGPDHAAVVGVPGELRLDVRSGEHGVRDHHACIGQESGREWPHQRRHRARQCRRSRVAEQQFEAFVRVDHGDGVGLGAERQGMETQG